MASESKNAELETLLETGNSKACLQFFHGMPEKGRRECFAVVKPFWSRVRKSRMIEEPPGTFRWNPLDGIASIAYFATATGSEILKAKRSGYPEANAAFEIIADRRPDWVDAWIESLLSESYYWNHWRLIRRLIREGFAKKPTNPRYYLGMISGLNSRHSKTSLVDEFKRDPELLQEEVWKLFEYDGEGENSLANTERFDRSWIEAFLILEKQGMLPRAQLLEACIEALERDFNHYRAKWFYEFFDRLAPTEQEIHRWQENFLGLLGATAPNVATWALGHVEALAKSGDVETHRLCQAIEPLLRARAKGTVLAALRLLKHQASLKPQEKSNMAATAAQALAHDSPDVQQETLKWLDSIAAVEDERVRSVVVSLQPSLAASARKMATDWIAKGNRTQEASLVVPLSQLPAASKKPPPPTSTSGASQSLLSKRLESLYSIDLLNKNFEAGLLALPAATFDGTDIARLVRVARLAPIENVEELIDVCARVIEDGSAVDDAERCIDGLARLGDSKPQNFQWLSAPLLKRIRKTIPKGCSPFCGLDPANDIMGLFYAFCTNKVIEPKPTKDGLLIEFEGHEHREFKENIRKPIGFLSAHCHFVANRIAAGEAWQLLSSPTHSGGWIDPIELAKRVNRWNGQAPHPHDLILAMLRLAPENRKEALESLNSSSSEWSQAIRYALGDDGVKMGKDASLWIAAARARAPWLDDQQAKKKHPGLGPDAAEAAKFELTSKMRKSGGFHFCDAKFAIEPPIPKSNDPLLVTVNFFTAQSVGTDLSFELGGFAGRTTGAVRWTARLWPIARESYFASSAVNCFPNLDWWEAMWQNRTMLEPMIDSGTPLRSTGLIFLCSMLAAKEPGESGLATDIAIRAIEEGRLGSDNLGNALRILLNSGLIKPGRWQKTLSEVSRTSHVHAAVIHVALQLCFESPKGELPKDTGKLLELLYELSLELKIPVSHEPCRLWLSSGTLTGKSSKLAKNLLAIETKPESIAFIRHILQSAIALRTKEALLSSKGIGMPR